MEALRLDGDITRLLKRLGLKRIGQLYDLPRTSLERRFHSRKAAEAVLHRLDQALGKREEPRNPSFPRQTTRRGFPSPNRSSPMRASSPASIILPKSYAKHSASPAAARGA